MVAHLTENQGVESSNLSRSNICGYRPMAGPQISNLMISVRVAVSAPSSVAQSGESYALIRRVSSVQIRLGLPRTGLNSDGRVSPLQGGSRRFDAYRPDQILTFWGRGEIGITPALQAGISGSIPGDSTNETQTNTRADNAARWCSGFA